MDVGDKGYPRSSNLKCNKFKCILIGGSFLNLGLE